MDEASIAYPAPTSLSGLDADTSNAALLRQGLALAYALHAGLAIEGRCGGRFSVRELHVLSFELISLLDALVRSGHRPSTADLPMRSAGE